MRHKLQSTALQVIALAETYSVTIASMLIHKRRPTGAEMRHLLLEVAPIISSSHPANVVLVAAWLSLMSIETALALAQLVVTGFLFVYGFRVGQLLHGTLFQQLLTSLFMAGTGLLIVLIKAIMH